MESKKKKFRFWTSLALWAVIAWLMGYIHGSSNTARETNVQLKMSHASIHVFQISNSIAMYKAQYGQWPSDRNGKPDFVYGPGTQSEVIDKLFETNGVSPEDCFRISISALKDDQVVDPWGVPYFIVFDTDGDGKCDTDRWGALPGSGPYVWTEGVGMVRSWPTNLATIAALSSPNAVSLPAALLPPVASLRYTPTYVGMEYRAHLFADGTVTESLNGESKRYFVPKESVTRLLATLRTNGFFKINPDRILREIEDRPEKIQKSTTNDQGQVFGTLTWSSTPFRLHGSNFELTTQFDSRSHKLAWYDLRHWIHELPDNTELQTLRSYFLLVESAMGHTNATVVFNQY